MTPGLGLLVFAVFGLIGIIRARSREHSQGYLRMYANDAYPIFPRNAIATYPFFLAGIAVFVLAGLVPRSVGGWVAMVAIAIVEVGVVVSYRVPPPFLPR